MELKSMKLDRKEKSQEMESEPEMDSPMYPWGLNIQLDQDSLEKIGMAQLPEVGSEMILMAKVKVSGIQQSDNANRGKNKSLELQITDLALEKPEKRKKPEEVMYS